MADTDDDVIPSGLAEAPKYPWFQRPAPSVHVTFGLALVSFLLACSFYGRRVGTLRDKFGTEHFQGSLRVCALISAYMDNYGYPRFATLKLVTKSLLFLGLLQLHFHKGFWIMWAILVLESSLDTIRVVLAYQNCGSITKVTALSEEEARDMRASTTLDPTNVYEDLTRPKSIAVMVFLVQTLLIGLVMDDTYQTTTRTCFNGKDGCAMLTSLGSYTLYLMGTFMASVFYVGPRNSYGQKEQNPTFWLKLFLMSKEQASMLTWIDPVTETSHTVQLRKMDWRIWLRFTLSYIVNGIGFHFLLHVLPIQVAGQSTIIGVVFRAIGMIYLADLDDSAGSKMTLVSLTTTSGQGPSTTEGETELVNGHYYGSRDNATAIEEAKQQIIDKAVEDVRAQMQVLMREGTGGMTAMPLGSSRRTPKLVNITNALLASAAAAKRKKNDENSPLVV
uniref:Uncharacterized protein n=1 Tax=Amphora coffeiformis TaxID=265554 RepID=A0A7S3P733_9STRA|mmetsp:Transcript_1313/g.2611  ORF Transcript_1313/g.2611 Transcript_1313/m.2611 type:complete len:447 (-) Transcript_1313:110-1450(-)|eukprot:scaffold35911_cov199-Amphora_coffeaeformis.AAC.3